MLHIDISNIGYPEIITLVEQDTEDYADIEIGLDFKSDYSQTKIIRDLIGYILEKNAVPPIWKNRLGLVGDELVTNVIEYGSLPEDMNSFRIYIKKSDSGIFVNLQAEDTGKGKSAKTSLEMEALRAKKKEEGFERYLGKRGRGLFQLISNLVDELYFRDSGSGGLIVGIKKTIQ